MDFTMCSFFYNKVTILVAEIIPTLHLKPYTTSIHEVGFLLSPTCVNLWCKSHTLIGGTHPYSPSYHRKLSRKLSICSDTFCWHRNLLPDWWVITLYWGRDRATDLCRPIHTLFHQFYWNKHTFKRDICKSYLHKLAHYNIK